MTWSVIFSTNSYQISNHFLTVTILQQVFYIAYYVCLELITGTRLGMPRANRTDDVYDFICDYNKKWGLPPTYAAIAKQLEMSVTAVRGCLDRLEGQGKIYREFYGKPAIRLIGNGNGVK